MPAAMPIIFLNSPGTTLSVDASHFTLRSEGRKIGRIPPSIIQSFVICHDVEVTRKALGRIGRIGIPAVFLDREGRIQCRLSPAYGTDPEPRLGQLRSQTRSDECLAIAAILVRSKIANQIAILNQWLSNHHDQDVASARDALFDSFTAAARSQDLETLRGHEGNAARIYFPAYGRTFLTEWTSFRKRTRRPPQDPVNALLSYTYAVLANRIHSFLETAGLDPYLGTLHTTTARRASLALDLLEPFRPAIADRFVRRALNLGQISAEHFEHQTFPSRAVYLNAAGRLAFLEVFSKWSGCLDTEEFQNLKSPDGMMIRTVEAYRGLMRDPAHSFQPFLLPNAPAL
jgi:CRISPR-associated protein Cas1